MEEKRETIFRKDTLERISSPDQLTDYLRVTNPRIWVVLASVILLLAGIFAWAAVGTLETKTEVKVVVQNRNAEIIPSGAEILESGMPLRVGGEDYTVVTAETDAYGRSIGTAKIKLPDGVYDGIVVTETIHPIAFLLTSG